MRNVNQSLKDKLQSNIQTDNKMSIQVSRAKTSVIDSTYWTVETIREKAGLGDISIAPRRLKSSGRPDRLYEIHVDNNQVSTALREYPDYQKDGWQHQFDLGPGSSVAIAFDGEWESYRNKWRLKTIGEPWLFWVDDTGKLMTKHWDDDTTLTELSSDVVKVKAIRAWKNVNIPVNDQGIVALYIKSDGKVYYRNYCRQDDGTYLWELEKQVAEFTGTAININMFISNDYRLGLLIEDSSHNVTMLVTNRNWSGMALGVENVSLGLGVALDIIEVTYNNSYEYEQLIASMDLDVSILYASSVNAFSSIINSDDGSGDYGYRVEFECDHLLFDLDVNDLMLTDSNNIEFQVISISLSGRRYTLETGDINNALGNITLTVKNQMVNNAAGYPYNEFSGVFTPENLVPTAIEPPSVEVIWNE